MDAPRALAMTAPRPVCVVHGELDEACPVEGVEEAVSAAEPWYASCGTSDRLQLTAFENVQDTVRPSTARGRETRRDENPGLGTWFSRVRLCFVCSEISLHALDALGAFCRRHLRCM
jgi:hypothetical protein